MEWNPILVRETRARFRHWGAFALLFGYSALLAIAMGWRYVEGVSYSVSIKNPLFRLSALGHELFLTLTWMQALAWALIAPANTASTIAREREDGLLEGVLLSPLKPSQILGGKLISALSFIALLLLISLPVQAVCFLMGGVSPEEFRSALFLHTVTALTGAIVGLSCSAWSRRANIALRSAYALIILWLIGSAVCFGMAQLPSNWLLPSTWNNFWHDVCALFGWTNPIVAACAIAIPDQLANANAPTGIFEHAPWTLSILFQVLLSILLLLSSTLALRRPFESRDEVTLNRWQKPVAPRADVSTPSAQGTQWIEIPGTSQLHFRNPVMQREARGKFRMKSPPLWLLIAEVLLALIVAYYYVLAFWAALFDHTSRETIWWVIAFIALFIVAISSAVMGASTFTREREGQTWEPLQLSLLSAQEIMSAKIAAILLALLVYSVPFWPLALPCVRSVLSLKDQPGDNGGITLFQGLATIGILTATAFCYGLWGMWWSWRSRRTVTAVGWALGSLFFLLVFAPAFLAAGLMGHSNADWLWVFHPFVTLGMVVDGKSTVVLEGVFCSALMFFTGVALWHRLIHEMIGGNETAQNLSR